MKLSTFGMPFLMSLVPAVSVAADKYGQYFCYVEHVAGIVHDVQSTYSGKVQLRDDEMKFFLKLTAVAPPPKGPLGKPGEVPKQSGESWNPEQSAAWNKYSLCKATVDYYIKLLENGKNPRDKDDVPDLEEWYKDYLAGRTGSSPHGLRSSIGRCFATDKLTVQYPKSTTVWEYFGYGEDIDQYHGRFAPDWVELSGDAFLMSLPWLYPSRWPVVVTGHCEKTDATAPPAAWPSPAKQPSAAPAQELYGFVGHSTCGDWDRPESGFMREALRGWLLGYISGIVESGDFQENILKTASAAGAESWIDNYCKIHPLNGLSEAGNAFMQELVNRTKNGTTK